MQDYPACRSVEQCFETPHLHIFQQEFAKHRLSVCYMAEYFLPDMDFVSVLPAKPEYELRLLTQSDFSGLYLPQWSNALCEKRKQLDILGVGAYKNGTLVGVGTCSADWG